MKAKRLLINFGIFLLSAFIIVYILIQLFSGMAVDVECEYANVANVENFIQTTGYIFRNETLISSQNSGVVNYQVKESEKVYFDQAIATIYKNSNYLSIKNKLSEIDEKIDILDKSSIETSYMTSNVSKLDSKVFSYLNKMKLYVLNNEISSISSSKKDMLITCNKRYLITNNISDFQNKIASLDAQKTKLTENQNDFTEIIKSPKAGYFSTMLDGFENSFSSSKIDALTVDEFSSLLSCNAEDYPENVIGKVITDFDWFTAVMVSNEEADGFIESRSYPISFIYSSNEKIDSTLYKKVSQTDSQNTVLIFKIDKIYSDFDYTRSQTVKIVKSTHSGIAIPKSSVRILDDNIGVYILEGSTVKFKKINIENSDENNFLCTVYDSADIEKRDYISKFDRIITIGKDLYEGRIIS